METKTCNLTEDEIHTLIIDYGKNLDRPNYEECIERINYFNKRLNAEVRTKEPKTDNTNQPTAAGAAPAQGWPSNG